MSYWRFGAMILTSTVVMFGLMYLNTYVWSHVFWSETRVYMAILMGAAMAIIMLSFMLSMYSSRAINVAIYGGSIVVFAAALWLVRSQATIDGVSYMRAMIPHHSIAILTSNRANIEDPRVRKLADEIIAAQQKEISEMRYLIAVLEGDVDARMPASLRDADAPAGTGSVEQALSEPVLATLDAEDLTPDEIARATGESDPRCRFLRTTRSDPILVTWDGGGGAVRAAIKLSGQMVALSSAGDDATGTLPSEGLVLETEGLVLEVVPRGGENAGAGTIADLRFELDDGLTVGYRGTWTCSS